MGGGKGVTKEPSADLPLRSRLYREKQSILDFT
jgi:hypothetical protein